MSKAKVKYLRDMYKWKTEGITLYNDVNMHNVTAMLNTGVLDINNPFDYEIMAELDRVIAGLKQRNPLKTHMSEIVIVHVNCIVNHWTLKGRKASDIIRIFKLFGFTEKIVLDSPINDTITMNAANY